MRLVRLILPAAVLLAACSDQSATTPENDLTSPPTALAVRDAATNGGYPGFYFLQPVVTDGAPQKPLNRDLRPSVEVCQLDDEPGGRPGTVPPTAATACIQVVKTFGINSFQPTESEYRLNWDTDDTDQGGPLDETSLYRISILVGNLELGFFDVNPQRPGANEVIEGVYSFNVGSVIPIGFYIEEGTLCTPVQGEYSECIEFTCELVAQGCTFTLDGEGLPGNPATLGISIPPQTTEFLTSTFGGAEFETFRFERLEDGVPCFTDPDTGEVIVDSPAFGPCARVTPLGPLGEPSFVQLKEPGIKSICIDYAQVTENVDGLPVRRPYQMLKQGEDGSITALAAVSSPVCGDPTQTAALDGDESPGVLGRLAQAFRPVMRALAPRPLRAIDLGRGGELFDFSTFQYRLGYELRYVAGSGGTGQANTALPGDLPRVQAVDEKQLPVANATVNFSVVMDNGTVTPIEVLTDTDGFAAVDTWVLGERGTNTLLASSFGGYDAGCFRVQDPALVTDPSTCSGDSYAHMMGHELQTGTVTFEATAIGDPALVDPTNPQLGTFEVNTVLPNPLEVTVRDAVVVSEALDVPGVTVTWEVTSGNGYIVDDQGNRVTTLTTVTGADGTTAITFQMGTEAGENTVTATVEGLAPATFTATGVPGAAAQVVKVSGDGQLAKVGTTLPQPLVVDVLDQFGNDTGDDVVWSVPPADGSSITVDAQNGNSATLTLGTAAGTYTATASFASLSAQFTATACGPGSGFGTASVDGVLDPDEWFCARSETLQVNLGGGQASAQIYWMNDADSVYFGVRVDGADKVNSLRIDFDNNGDGILVAREDAINFDPSQPQGSRYTDEYLTQSCVNRSQSGCGALDPDAADGSGAFNNAGGVTVYELSKALDSGDVDHDFVAADLNANPLGVGLSGFVTFRIGNGAKGNTQWPGFREFYFFPLVPIF